MQCHPVQASQNPFSASAPLAAATPIPLSSLNSRNCVLKAEFLERLPSECPCVFSHSDRSPRVSSRRINAASSPCRHEAGQVNTYSGNFQPSSHLSRFPVSWSLSSATPGALAAGCFLAEAPLGFSAAGPRRPRRSRAATAPFAVPQPPLCSSPTPSPRFLRPHCFQEVKVPPGFPTCVGARAAYNHRQHLRPTLPGTGRSESLAWGKQASVEAGRDLAGGHAPSRWAVPSMAGLEQPAAGTCSPPQAEAHQRSSTASDAPATDSASPKAGAQALAFAPLGDGEARHMRLTPPGDTPCNSLSSAARQGGLAGSSQEGTGGSSTRAESYSRDAADRATEAGAELPDALDGSRLPRHVAVIMDGNSRWAERRGLPKEMGHEAGVQALKRTVKMAGQWGIPALTVFAFSTENWKRPKAEVVFLMALLERLIADDIAELHRQGVVVRVIGDLSKLPENLQRKIEETRVLTCKNQGLKLTVAVSYSGRQDIVQACRRIAEQVAAGQLDPADITDEMLDSSLETAWLGPELASPDLLIRTSGEHRISNFLLWQAAYTELVFTPALWPDFDREHFVDCLVEFQSRDRRFGGRHGPQTTTSGSKNQ